MDEQWCGRRTAGYSRRRMEGIARRLHRWLWALVAGVLAIGALHGVAAAEGEEPFDAAARLYEQGKFREAAAAYQALLTNGVSTVSVLFNQGNAWFKAGEKGRAIACYRQARKLAPRDPDVSANLDWVRSQLGSAAPPQYGTLDRFLGILTPNEWAAAAILGVWLWFGLMLIRELQPGFRGAGLAWSWALGIGVIVLMALAVATKLRDARGDAVVIVSEATVRFGPLEEAQAAFTLSDGAELVVTDRKGAWVEVRDATGRRGWMTRRNVALIP